MAMMCGLPNTQLGLSQVADTLHMLGLCVLETEGPGKAKKFFLRALTIEEARCEETDERLAVTLHALARCVREAEGPAKVRPRNKRLRPTRAREKREGGRRRLRVPRTRRLCPVTSLRIDA